MALQPCEEVNNIHEGKAYRISRQYKNTTSSSVSYSTFLSWIASQINGILDALPDGYYCCIESIMNNSVVTQKWYSTTGNSHSSSFTVVGFGTTGASAYAATANYYTFAPTAADSHYIGTNIYSSTQTPHAVNHDSDEAVAPNSTRDVVIWFTLLKVDSSLPTE